MDLDAIFKNLTCKQKLDRDKACRLFETSLQSISTSDFDRSCQFVVNTLNGSDLEWFVEFGALLAAKSILTRKGVDNFPPEFCSTCEEACFRLMADKEYRVRDLSAEVIGSLASVEGSQLWLRRRQVVFDNIRQLLESDRTFQDSVVEGEQSNRSSRSSSPSPTREQRVRQLDVWKALEVWTKCWQCIVENSFEGDVDDEVLATLSAVLEHKDRYIRETGFLIVSTLLKHRPSLRSHFVEYLKQGLSDNWSHVRLAACEATRSFFSGDCEEIVRLFPHMLPPLCLNRYHLAAGVRLHSQETWKLATKGEGKTLVEKNLPQVVDYYVEQCQSKNHEVREATVNCIAELGVKVKEEVVGSHVDRLLATLMSCYDDDSWPVRDGACQASAKIIKRFPDQSKARVGDIINLMGENLKDSMTSVRSGAASALASIATTYEGEIRDRIVDTYVFKGLEAVKDQPDEAHRMEYPAQVIAINSEQVGDACNTHLRRIRRPAEPWEVTDGAISLFVEVAGLLSRQQISRAIELIVEATNKRDYSQHGVLLATLCKQLPDLAKCLGKQMFKAHLEQFLDPLFYAVDQQHLALVDGDNCIVMLSRFIGPSVFRGRVTNYNSSYLRQLDRLIPPNY